MMAPGYKMSRFDIAEITRIGKRTPEQYIKWVGGVGAAMNNFNCLRGQSKDGITSPFWEQVKALCKKALQQ